MKILFAIGLLAALPLAAQAQQPAGVPHPGTVRRSTGADGLCPAEMAIHGRKPRRTQSR